MRDRGAMARQSRRGFLAAAAGVFGGAVLGGCDRFANSDLGARTLALGEDANLFVQRLLLRPTSMAREFPQSAISPWFKPNGTTDPEDGDYRSLAASGFAGYRLRLDGLVARPLALSLDELRALPARTQITRHDCVEGWSAIGQWTGVPLAHLIETAWLKPQARYIVFHCADTMEYEEAGSGEAAARVPVRYYESIDLVDAVHPQTILAYDLNGKALPVLNGAPLRLRVERQLGYKQAKYVMRIEVTDTLAGHGAGKGGYWEDRGYEWYAGI